MFTLPLLLFDAPTARELSNTTRGHCNISGCTYQGRRRSRSLHSYQTREWNNPTWFACSGHRFNIHRVAIDIVLKHANAYVRLGQGLHLVVGSCDGDGDKAGELVQTEDDESDRYRNDLTWDPYLGEVTISEKVEEPSQYVPPPPVSAEDVCVREKVESILYTLEKILPGQLNNDKADVLCSMLSDAVEVQNPAACFCGRNKCSEWLRALIQVQASVNLHEIYYENDVEFPDKRWIYAVWTVSFLEPVHITASNLIDNMSESEPIQLSGETVFAMERSGLVSRISSTWYVLLEDDWVQFSKAKTSLQNLLLRTF